VRTGGFEPFDFSLTKFQLGTYSFNKQYSQSLCSYFFYLCYKSCP
jgi:hypothetical protein